MHRIDNATSATILPAPKPAGTPGFFTTGSIGGQLATIVEADWANMVQEELAAILAAAAMVPDKTNNAQVIAAILWLIRSLSPIAVAAAPQVYTVNPLTGIDAPTSPAASLPFATLTYGYRWLQQNLNANGQQITINCQFPSGPTAYAAFEANGPVTGIFSPSQLLIVGDNAAQHAQINVINQSAAVEADNGAIFKMTGFEISATGSQGTGVVSTGGSRIALDHMSFGNCVYRCMATGINGALIDISGASIAINSAGLAAISAGYGGTANLQGASITFGSGSTFNGTLEAINKGLLVLGNAVNFLGTVPNARRFTLSGLSMMETAGRQTTVSTAYVPGTSDGVTSGGSQFE